MAGQAGVGLQEDDLKPVHHRLALKNVVQVRNAEAYADTVIAEIVHGDLRIGASKRPPILRLGTVSGAGALAFAGVLAVLFLGAAAMALAGVQTFTGVLFNDFLAAMPAVLQARACAYRFQRMSVGRRAVSFGPAAQIFVERSSAR